MEWTITIHQPELIGSKGSIIPEKTETHVVPFECGQYLYYAHKKKWWKENSKWVLTRCRVTGMWASGTYGITVVDEMHIDGMHLCVDEFKYLFTDREEAIEYCIKKNAHAKVKIYGE